MGERRTSMIERILHRIEDHVEEWRRQDSVRKTEAETHRQELWAEAAQRQELLAEAIADEEAGRSSLEEITKQHRVVFVLHCEDLTETLETFAGEKNRLVNAVPGKVSRAPEARGWCSRRRSKKNSLARDRTVRQESPPHSCPTMT